MHGIRYSAIFRLYLVCGLCHAIWHSQCANSRWPGSGSPEFTYARVKVKLRTYDAAGNGIDKSVAIRRNPVLAGTNGCPTTNPISPNNSCYAFVEANTNIATAGATFINWVTKSEFVVDNPDADDMSGFGPSSNDCYDTATIRVISPLISL